MRLRPFLLSLLLSVPSTFDSIRPVEGASLSINDPLRLQRVGRNEISGGRRREQNWNLGIAKASLVGKPPYTVNNLSIGSFLGPNRYITRRVDRVWRLDFASGEWFGPISVDVHYRLEDGGGGMDRISSVEDANSKIMVTVRPAGEQIRRRTNGSLNWIRGGAEFELDILTARAAGQYSGVLTVEVNFF